MSNIISIQDAKNAHIRIKKDVKFVNIELSHELYNMLLIECKLTVFNATAGKGQQVLQDFIKQNRLISTIQTFPAAEDLPTNY